MLQQRKNKNDALTNLEKDLEAERERLYIIVNQFGFSGKHVIKQSNILDEFIVQDLINQLDKKRKNDQVPKRVIHF